MQLNKNKLLNNGDVQDIDLFINYFLIINIIYMN